MRQICILFPWHRTALREFVVTVFHPCHQKLLPPLIHGCKEKITVSIVNSRDPLECLWLPFTDLIVKAEVQLNTFELIPCQFILKALHMPETQVSAASLAVQMGFCLSFSFCF